MIGPFRISIHLSARLSASAYFQTPTQVSKGQLLDFFSHFNSERRLITWSCEVIIPGRVLDATSHGVTSRIFTDRHSSHSLPLHPDAFRLLGCPGLLSPGGVLRFHLCLRVCPKISTPAVRSASQRTARALPVAQIRDYARQTSMVVTLTVNCIGLFNGAPGGRRLRSYIHRCFPGDRPSTRNTRHGTETAF